MWHRQGTCEQRSHRGPTSTVMKSSTYAIPKTAPTRRSSATAKVGNLQNAFTAELRPENHPFHNCVRTRSLRRPGQLAERVQYVLGPKPGFEPIGHAQAVALNLRRGGSPLVFNGQDDGQHRKGDVSQHSAAAASPARGCVRCARLGAHQQ